MADKYGIKISKEGKSVHSDNIDDFIFRSDIQSLPIIQKVSVQKTINSGDCEGTYIYTHNLGFFPFTKVYITDKSFSNNQIVPFYITGESKTVCGGDVLLEDFEYSIKENTIEINYNVKCVIPQIGESCPSGDVTYTFEIELYMFELGSTT